MSDISTHQQYLQWKARAADLREKFEAAHEGVRIQDDDSFLAEDWRIAVEKMSELTVQLYKEHATRKPYNYKPSLLRRGQWKNNPRLHKDEQRVVQRTGQFNRSARLPRR